MFDRVRLCAVTPARGPLAAVRKVSTGDVEKVASHTLMEVAHLRASVNQAHGSQVCHTPPVRSGERRSGASALHPMSNYLFHDVPLELIEAFKRRASFDGWSPNDLLVQLMRDYVAGYARPSARPPRGALPPNPWQDLPAPTDVGDLVIDSIEAIRAYELWHVVRTDQQRPDAAQDVHRVSTMDDAIAHARTISPLNRVYVMRIGQPGVAEKWRPLA